MSKRTAEASKAIRGAWEKERQYVLEGKGTRDWTPEQQQSILEKGRVYDNNGKAFEGHHMKSVAAYPDFQGYADNIQFLSRTEHVEAHGGDTHNPTNGYYNPTTKTTVEFSADEYTPCDIIQLSQPIAIKLPIAEAISKTNEANVSEVANAKKEQKVEVAKATKPPLPKKTNKSFGKRAFRLASNALEFGRKHPNAVRLLKLVGAAGFSWVVSKGFTDRRMDYSDHSGFDSSNYDIGSVSSVEKHTDVPAESEYPEKRKSPVEHTVTSHRQRYGKNKEWKEKSAYPRGGEKNQEGD